MDLSNEEFIQIIHQGANPSVTFSEAILNTEGYLEPNMRGQITGITIESADVARLKINLTPFDEFNRQFEQSNYYDKQNSPCLTAREAGEYKEKIVIFIDPTRLFDYFAIVDNDRIALVEAWLKDNSLSAQNTDRENQAQGCSYVEWLERRVLDLESSTNQLNPGRL